MGQTSSKTTHVKVLSIDVDCPHCGHYQHVDAGEFEEEKLAAFTEYKTSCDACDRNFEFTLDLH